MAITVAVFHQFMIYRISHDPVVIGVAGITAAAVTRRCGVEQLLDKADGKSSTDKKRNTDNAFKGSLYALFLTDHKKITYKNESFEYPP